jgi:serine acetyltransferase
MISLLRQDIIRLVSLTGYTYFRVLTSGMFFAVLFIRFRASSFFIFRIISKFLLSFCFAIEVGSKVNIGPGLFLPHPRNIILGCFSIGANCTVMHGVTLGARRLDFDFCEDLRPKIGDNCFLGVGSVVLGGGVLTNSSVVKPNTYLVLE